MEEVTEKELTHTVLIKIFYDPDDNVWDPRLEQDERYWYGDWRKRKKRVSFLLYSDEFLNYDLLTPEDMDFYLYEWRMRGDYLDMLPTLHNIKRAKLKEREEEDNFAKFLMSRLGYEAEPYIREAVDWWKFKVIYRRPLISEDTKTVRMIMKRVRSKMNFKRDNI